MADGISSGGGGFGETLFDATKKTLGGQLQKTVQTAGAQLTGQTFGNAKQTPQTNGTFTPPQTGGAKNPFAGKMPPNMGDFGKFLEKNQLGAQKQGVAQVPQTNYKTPQELEEMANVQDAKDAQEIKKLTQELHGFYAKNVLQSGEEAVRKEKEYLQKQRDDDEQEGLRRNDAKRQENNAGPVGPGQFQAGKTTTLLPGPNVTQADRSGESGKHTG